MSNVSILKVFFSIVFSGIYFSFHQNCNFQFQAWKETVNFFCNFSVINGHYRGHALDVISLEIRKIILIHLNFSVENFLRYLLFGPVSVQKFIVLCKDRKRLVMCIFVWSLMKILNKKKTAVKIPFLYSESYTYIYIYIYIYVCVCVCVCVCVRKRHKLTES